MYTECFAITEELSKPLPAARYIVFATRNADRSAWQSEDLSAIPEVKYDDAEVIVISTCAPYNPLNVKIDFPVAYFATFEFARLALEAVTRVILGEAKVIKKILVLGGKALRNFRGLRLYNILPSVAVRNCTHCKHTVAGGTKKRYG